LWRHSGDSRRVIYDHNIFIIYADRAINNAPKTFIVQASLMMSANYDCHIFIVQATDRGYGVEEVEDKC